MASHLENNSYGLALIVVGWTLLILGAFFIALRIWSRNLKKQALGANDWLSLGALLWNTVLIAHTTQTVVQLGLGRHAEVVGEANSRSLLKSLFGLKPEWAFANALVKLSMLHLYTTLFARKWVKIASYCTMVLAILYSLAAFLEIFLSCFPMAYMWNPKDYPQGYCIDLSKAWVAVGLTNMIEDILIIIIPLPTLWSLKMNLKRKIALMAIFSLGVFIIIVTGIRIKVIIEFDPLDISYHLGPITFWSVLEPLLGLINCCLPLIQPAINKLSGERLWSTGGRSTKAPWNSSKNLHSKTKNMHSHDDMFPLSSIDEHDSKRADYIVSSTGVDHV